MRLFIAVTFSAATCSHLLALRDGWYSLAERGNFSAPGNLHLTLVFLGECDIKRAAAAKAAMSAVRFEPFAITIGGHLDKGRSNLLFCELKNDGGYNQLLKIHSELYTNLSGKGFKLDNRKFWPHITIGRNVVCKDSSICSGLTDAIFPAIQERVSDIVLMQSERIQGKLTYTPVFPAM